MSFTRQSWWAWGGGGGGGGGNRSCSKPCIAQAFWSKSANLGPSCEFARTAHKRSRNQLEIYLQPGRRRFWEFGAISGTYQNQPYSKPWAAAQVLCSRSGAPAARWSDRKQFEIHLQTCRRKFLGFPAPKSAIFKMGYGHASSTSANFGPLPIHLKSTRTIPLHEIYHADGAAIIACSSACLQTETLETSMRESQRLLFEWQIVSVDQNGKIYTLFQTRNAWKRYPLGRHIMAYI